MRVDLVDTMEGFAALEGAWVRLHAGDPDAGYFLSWLWLAEVFKANPGTWRVLALRPATGEDPVCLMPLRLKTRWSRSRGEPVTELDVAGRLSWAQYAGFLCLAEWEDDALPALAAAIRNDPWAYFRITNWLVSDRRREIFLQGFVPEDYESAFEENTMRKGAINNLVRPYVPLAETFEAYLDARVSANTRQKIRRFLRRIEGAPDLRLIETPSDQAKAHLDLFLDLWFRKWAPVRGEATAGEVVVKYREILAQSLALGAVYVPPL
jgi:CelD/BcsL family acetyltransferase involved in cellulose biosynthesis